MKKSKQILILGLTLVSLIPTISFGKERDLLLEEYENRKDLIVDPYEKIESNIVTNVNDMVSKTYLFDEDTDSEQSPIEETILEERNFKEEVDNFFSGFKEDEKEEKLEKDLTFVNQVSKKESDAKYAFAKKSKVYRSNGYAYTTTEGDILILRETQGKFFIYSKDGSNKIEIPSKDIILIDKINEVKNLDQRLKRSQAINKVIAFSLNQLNKPYKWGATGPSAYDCSGLSSAAYKQIGIDLPRTSYNQCFFGQRVKGDDLRPGDLVFFRITKSSGHVGIYLGEDKFIHAPKPGDSVKISTLSERKNIFGARRII